MRSLRALVIGSDPESLASIDDTLVAMDHEYKGADCLLEARRLIRAVRFDYVLLAAMLPARPGGVPLVSNSHRFLPELHEARDGRMEPVIVLLPHEDGYPESTKRAAVRMAHGFMKRGAADFIDRPFPTGGRTLDRVIEKVLAEHEEPVQPDKTNPALEHSEIRNQSKKIVGRSNREGRNRIPPLKTSGEDATTVGASTSPPEASTQPISGKTSLADERCGCWADIPNEPIQIDGFMARFCEHRSKPARLHRKHALQGAARHKTVTLPPLGAPHKHGQAKKYLVHDLLAAWQGYLDEGVDLPPLLPEHMERASAHPSPANEL